LHLKLLVDSSSAMPAERLLPVHHALDKLLGQLQPEDLLSCSRFGERTVHELPRLQPCTEAYRRRACSLARHTDSDLGTANPLAALQAVLAITDEDEQSVAQADILLVTASPLWAIDAPLRALRTAGHRLHVMALGDASDSLWRELAQASGGACEVLAPGQHSLPTLERLLARMRQTQSLRSWITLEGAQAEHTPPGETPVADGDTLHLWASASTPSRAQDLTGRPELRASLHWQSHETTHTLPATTVLWDELGDVARLRAAQQALWMENETERAQCLAQHGLVVPDMRALAALTPATADTHTTTSTLATRPKVLPSAPSLAARGIAQPSAVPSSEPARPAGLTAGPQRATPAPAVLSLRPAPPRHADLAGWLSEPQAPGNPLTALVQGFNQQASNHARFRAALSGTLHQVPTRFLDSLVLQLARQAGNPGRVWALLLHWLHAEHAWSLSDPALALLAQELGSMPVAMRSQLCATLAQASVPMHPRAAA
jgi:hypothetical protein